MTATPDLHARSSRPWRTHLAFVTVLTIVTGLTAWWEHDNPALREWLVAKLHQDETSASTLWWMLTDLGLGESLALVLLTVLVLSGDRRRLQDAAAAAILAGIFVNLVKLLVERERPVPNGSYSWPSGHSAAAAAVAAALSGWRPAVTAGSWLTAAGVATSRVMRGRHWHSDVLGGVLVGSACGLLARRLPSFLPEALERERVRVVIAWGVVVAWLATIAWKPDVPGTNQLITAVPALACGLWATTRASVDEGILEGARWRAWLGFAALFAVVLLLGRAGTGHFALLDLDEPRFAAASRTMLEAGDWVVPHFNGTERFDKPVLVYWLQAAAMKFAQPVEAAARLPSAFGIALAAVATAGIARLLGLLLLPALLAGAIAGTVPLAQGMAHGSTADGLLYGLCTAVAFVQVWRFRRGPGAGSFVALWTGVALAFLTKGPPAVVGPLALGLGLCWAGARPRLWPTIGGLALTIALVAAWAVPALVATEGRFWTIGVIHHVVERSLEPFEGHGGYAVWWYLTYLVTIPLTMLPWSLLLPWAWHALRARANVTAGIATGIAGEERPHAVPRLLLGWLIGVVGTFTLVVSKLPHYVLPCYPALALAIVLGRREAAMPRVAMACRAVGVVLGLALPIAAVASGFGIVIAPALTAGVGLAATLWVAGGQLVRARTVPAVAALAVGLAIGMAALFARGLPLADSCMIASTFAAELPAQVRKGETVHLYRMIAPTVTFYLDRVTPEERDEAAAVHQLAQPGHLLLLRDTERDGLLQAIAKVAATEPEVAARAKAALQTPRWSGSGFWPTKGKLVRMLLCGQGATTRGGGKEGK